MSPRLPNQYRMSTISTDWLWISDMIQYGPDNESPRNNFHQSCMLFVSSNVMSAAVVIGCCISDFQRFLFRFPKDYPNHGDEKPEAYCHCCDYDGIHEK